MSEISKIANSGIPLVLEAKHDSHLIRVNKAMFEDRMINQTFGEFESLSVFTYFDEENNLVGASVWNSDKDKDEYYIVGRINDT